MLLGNVASLHKDPGYILHILEVWCGERETNFRETNFRETNLIFWFICAINDIIQ